jgi:Flp pilus assembly protein protease CpaA
VREMNVSWQNMALYAPLLILIGYAAVTDLRVRRIPNWLTLTVVLTGVVQSFTPVAVTSVKESLLGLSAGFAVTFLLYMMGGRGAGDVKLTAGIGAWIGPWPVIAVLMVAALVSLAVALGTSVARGKLRDLFRGTGIMLTSLVHARQFGVRRVIESGREGSTTFAQPMPNAVSMLLATVAVVIWISAGRGFRF